MLFKGRLRLPSDPGEGIPIDLELEDVYLSLDSEGEDFGEWRLDTVEIKRLFSNQFSMLLDGEEMVFVADDALGFAYDGLSAVEDVKSRLGKRRFFKGRKPKKRSVLDVERSDGEEEEAQVEESIPEPSLPDAPMPEVVPFFPESSPSFSESVAESTTEDDAIAPIAPRPIEPTGSEPPRPAASAPEQPPPAAREVEPRPAPPVEPPSAAPAAPPPAAAAPVEDQGFDDDDEFVIEEVAAYGYVPNLASAVPAEQVTEEPDQTEDAQTFEIEDADVATGATQRQVHETADRQPAPRADDVHPLGEPSPPAEVEPASEPASEPAPEPAPDPTPAPPQDPPASFQHPSPIAPSAAAPGAAQFGEWSSNGRRDAPSDPPAAPEPDPEPERPQTQKSGRHERSSGKSRSLFGRKKSREPEEHEHRYESSKTVGGITRSVCAICGHVSFAGEDVYQDW